MLENCIFCKISKKEAPASLVYEDEKVIAFMSIRPINVGHTLVVPKKHYLNIYEISENEVAHLYTVVKKLSHAVQKAVDAEGIRIVQNNGEAAGQVVLHMHVHIIPMNRERSWMHHAQMRDADALKEDAQKIREFV